MSEKAQEMCQAALITALLLFLGVLTEITGSPVITQIDVLSATSVRVKWKPLTNKDTKDMIQGYVIFYKNAQELQFNNKTVQGNTTSSARVERLVTGEHYCFKMAALKSTGLPTDGWAEARCTWGTPEYQAPSTTTPSTTHHYTSSSEHGHTAHSFTTHESNTNIRPTESPVYRTTSGCRSMTERHLMSLQSLLLLLVYIIGRTLK